MTVTAADHGSRDCTGARADVLSAELAEVQEQAANLRAALASNRMIGMAVGWCGHWTPVAEHLGRVSRRRH